MSLPRGLWKETECLSETSSERRRLRLVLFTADSSRILLKLHDELCWVVAVVTPEEFRPGSPRAVSLAHRLYRRIRRAFTTETPLESVAAELRVPLIHAWTLADPALLGRLRRLDVDVIVVAGYPEIFPDELLSLPRFGCVNVHASLLPRYRGPQPIAQALLHGEAYTGVTVHRMERRVDAGDILAQDVVPILESDTVYTLAARIFELGGRILVDVLERLALGKLEPRAQAGGRATTFKRLPPDAGRVDWSQRALDIGRLLRLTPWLQVYTYVGTSKIVLRGGKATESAPTGGQPARLPPENWRPGMILARQGSRLEVLAGDGGRVVIPAAIPASRWPGRLWAGRKLRPGIVLDPNWASDGSGRDRRERNPTPFRAILQPAETSRTRRSSSSASDET